MCHIVIAIRRRCTAGEQTAALFIFLADMLNIIKCLLRQCKHLPGLSAVGRGTDIECLCYFFRRIVVPKNTRSYLLDAVNGE